MSKLMSLFAVCLSVALIVGTTAHGIVVTQDYDANNLGTALTAGAYGVTNVSATMTSVFHNGWSSAGTYTNASGTYGIGDGIIMSSGNVSDYGDGPNTVDSKSTGYGVPATAAQEVLLDQITGGSFDHYDATQFDLTFDMLSGYDTIYFNMVWGSDEYPEWVGTQYIDAFGIFLNGVNIAEVAGSPVNVNHPNMAAVAGTELDGILLANGGPVSTFDGYVGDGSTGNTLTFIIADSGDDVWDSTVYFSAFGGTPPEPVPEPGTLLLIGTGLAGLAGYGLRLRRKKK
jgi:hypothetical protein